MALLERGYFIEVANFKNSAVFFYNFVVLGMYPTIVSATLSKPEVYSDIISTIIHVGPLSILL